MIQVHRPSSSDPEDKTREQLLPTTASNVPPGFHAFGARMDDEDVTMCTIPKCS